MLHIDLDKNIQIGALYSKEGDTRVFTFLDIYEKIVFIDMSDSYVHETTLDSIVFKEDEKKKVGSIPYFVAAETWGSIITELKMLT